MYFVVIYVFFWCKFYSPKILLVQKKWQIWGMCSVWMTLNFTWKNSLKYILKNTHLFIPAFFHSADIDSQQLERSVNEPYLKIVHRLKKLPNILKKKKSNFSSASAVKNWKKQILWLHDSTSGSKALILALHPWSWNWILPKWDDTHDFNARFSEWKRCFKKILHFSPVPPNK